jgi:exonuclease III
VSNARGTANTFEFVVHKEKKDDNGNYIMLDFSIEGKRVTLINIYGPNKDSPFLKSVVENAEFFENNHYVFCGDLNSAMNPSIDCRFYKDNIVNNPNAREFMLEVMEDLDIIDVYRELYPDRRRYTWRKKTQQS